MPRSTRWRWIALSTLVVPAVVALAMLLTSGEQETLGPIRGLRLGLAPSQVRRQLVTPASGSFATVAMGEDFALIWTPDSTSSGDLRSARMEFHLGQLVALRLSVSPAAPEARGPALEHTAASVLSREHTPSGVELTWLARSCPTHADEVRLRMAEHS